MVENLYSMIKYLQRGTNLHIGVLFFGNYGNKMCELPHEHTIHSGSLCEFFKTRSNQGYRRCFKCRNLAIKKALETKKSFGGLCINGIYEYTHPVMINNDVACIIFIGNILNEEKGHTLPPDTLEKDFSIDDCTKVGNILESYILMLLEKYTDKNADVNPLIENVKNYIISNLEFDIDIAHISEFFHYNKLYLGRLFKKETNMTVNDYVNHKRLEKAKTLLINTADTVIDISNKIGFNNVTYFNRLFKKNFKVTPTQYRKEKG